VPFHGSREDVEVVAHGPLGGARVVRGHGLGKTEVSRV
jgi:hypothetical protein